MKTLLMLDPTKIKVPEILIPQLVQLGYVSKSNESFISLKKHIKTKGLLSPIFINDDKELASGYYRLQAAIALRLEEVPIVYVKGATAEEQNKEADLWMSKN